MIDASDGSSRVGKLLCVQFEALIRRCAAPSPEGRRFEPSPTGSGGNPACGVGPKVG